MDERALVEEEWRCVVSLLPGDFEERAFAKFTIRRRRRVASGEELLRLVLAYSVCDFSLRQLAAWARVSGLAELSDVAVLKRLRGASAWLGDLAMAWLTERGLTRQVPPLSVRVIDASVVMTPGGVGADWRVHAGLDLAVLRLTSVEVSGPEGGESLARHVIVPGEVALADRGYAHREAVAEVLKAGAHVVVRGNWQNFPPETRRGGRLDVVACLETLAPGEIGDWPVRFHAGRRTYPLRLVAVRKSQAATAREQKKILRKSGLKLTVDWFPGSGPPRGEVGPGDGDDAATEGDPGEGWVVGAGQATGQRLAGVPGDGVQPGQFLPLPGAV